MIKAAWTQGEAIREVESLSLKSDIEHYVTFHKTKKIFYITNYQQKMYNKILIAVYLKGLPIR